MDLNILRENDIRGEYPSQVNKEVAKKIGQAFGTFIKNHNAKECLIGHDNRLSSEELHTALIEGVLSTGINVTDIGLCTTALFNYSDHMSKIGYGIMITASHNQASDNGFKIFGDDYLHLEGEELAKVYEVLKKGEFVSGKGEITKTSYKDEYIKMLTSKAKIDKKIKVVFDCGNGTTSILVKEVFDQLNIDVTYLNAESDGSFPVHNPDPNVVENLKWLAAEVKKQGADIGIGLDGDGDRIGIVDENGAMVATDILIGIYAADIIPQSDNKNVILDVKCSKALEIELKRIGARPIMLKNGSAYIETQMAKVPALIGGEYSGHVFFRDDYYGFDDGVYAAIRIIELLSKTDKKCSELYSHIEHFHNTPEIRVQAPDDKKWGIIDQIKAYCQHQDYEFTDIDGVRVNYPDGFSLIRGSNTGPTITLRFEAKNEKDLDLRQREFLNFVEFLIK